MGYTRRVLVADDDEDVRDVLTQVLEQNGFDVIAVDSGADALAYLARDVPSLMLLDLCMHDMDGWQVLAAMRADVRLNQLPVFVLTGMDAEPDPKPANVTLLRKPMRPSKLMDEIRAVCGQSWKN